MGKEKKEIGKLIELLNEYLKKEDKSIYTFYWNQVFNCIHRGNGERCDKEWICSKSFGFIKWLVDNDKIDRSKFKKYSTGNTQGEREIQKIYYYGRISTNELNYTEGYSEVDELLMILSIQDNPIEFLISILKIS